MPETKLYVTLLSHTAEPAANVARASKLCYSASHIKDLGEEVAKVGESEVVV